MAEELKKSKKGITIPFWVRLSLDIYVYYGATLTIVRVRVVVHKFLRKITHIPTSGKASLGVIISKTARNVNGFFEKSSKNPKIFAKKEKSANYLRHRRKCSKIKSKIPLIFFEIYVILQIVIVGQYTQCFAVQMKKEV
jgi:hypothetical protein